MKFSLFLILIFAFGRGVAQTHFYINPIIFNKFSISSTQNYGSKSPDGFSDKFAENPYILVDNKVLTLNRGFLLGCLFGMNFNEKRLIELGWSMDVAGSSVSTHRLTLSKFNNPRIPDAYSSSASFFSSNLFTNKFLIQYYGIINRISTKNIYNYFNFGIDLIYNPSAANPKKGKSAFISEYEVRGDSNSFAYVDSSFFLVTRETHTVVPTNRFVVGTHIGLNTDFYNDKKKYLFSACLFYMHSFANLVALVNQYTILDDGVTKVYSYNTYSNGSGIYFQLSRRIQFKNWKDKVKKNDLGLPQM